MDPPSQVAQLGQRQAGLVTGVLDQLDGLGVARLGATFGHAQRQGQRHEALLRAVVEVALDAPPLGVTGGDDARARVLEVGHLCRELRIGAAAQE